MSVSEKNLSVSGCNEREGSRERCPITITGITTNIAMSRAMHRVEYRIWHTDLREYAQNCTDMCLEIKFYLQ